MAYRYPPRPARTYGIEHWDEVPDNPPELAPLIRKTFGFLVDPILAAAPYRFRDEDDLHCALGRALIAAGLPVQHEASLADGRRIDLASRFVGIEVKVKDKWRDEQGEDQVWCYGASRSLSAVLVVTTGFRYMRATHNDPVPGDHYVPTCVLHVGGQKDRLYKSRDEFPYGALWTRDRQTFR